MEKIFNIVTLEMKRKSFIKNSIITIVVLIPILLFFSIIGKLIDIPVDIPVDIPLELIKMISYICLANYCFSLTQEFTNKTDKIIFTGIYSKSEIVISKLINFCIINLINFIFYEVVTITFNIYIGQDISKILNLKTLGNNLYVFLVYAFTLGSFILLVSICTTNGVFTGIITYALHFDLILVIFSKALSFSKNEVLKWVIKNSTFYNANMGFYNLKYNVNQSIVMITSGIIFLLAACFIISKKDI